MPIKDREVEVLAAAANLVAAFARHDKAAYFSCFAFDATFIFHTCDRRLASRSEYEKEWNAWEADGFQVLACRSIDPHVKIISDDVAIFTHSVETELAGVAETQRERETIVFSRQPDGRWLGVHEHLSLDPAGLK